MITQNEFVTELEQAWDNLNWHRKFEYSTPDCGEGEIEYAWHAYSKQEIEEASLILKNLEEDETEDGIDIARSAHLGSYSSGEAIVICKYILEEE